MSALLQLRPSRVACVGRRATGCHASVQLSGPQSPSSTCGARRRRDQELLSGWVRAKEPLSEPNHMRALPWIWRSAIHEVDKTGMNLRPADARIRESSFVAFVCAHHVGVRAPRFSIVDVRTQLDFGPIDGQRLRGTRPPATGQS